MRVHDTWNKNLVIAQPNVLVGINCVFRIVGDGDDSPATYHYGSVDLHAICKDITSNGEIGLLCHNISLAHLKTCCAGSDVYLMEEIRWATFNTACSNACVPYATSSARTDS